MDKIFSSWLAADWEKAQALDEASGLLDVERLDPQHFVAHFHSPVLVRGRDGAVREADRCDVGYWLAENHLREVDPAQVGFAQIGLVKLKLGMGSRRSQVGFLDAAVVVGDEGVHSDDLAVSC